jgi:hypothetical protein
MKPRKNKFILFVFAKSEDQDTFVTQIAEEIALITKTNNLRYYYGGEACVFTFDCVEDFNAIQEYVDIILSEDKIVYFLLPYSNDNLSYSLPKTVSDHLFGDNLSDIKKMDQDLEKRFKKLDEELFDKMLNFMDDEDDDDNDHISKLIKQTKTVTKDNYISENEFNSVLDKINSDGMSALTKKELDLLKQYSNQVK